MCRGGHRTSSSKSGGPEHLPRGSSLLTLPTFLQKVPSPALCSGLPRTPRESHHSPCPSPSPSPGLLLALSKLSSLFSTTRSCSAHLLGPLTPQLPPHWPPVGGEYRRSPPPLAWARSTATRWSSRPLLPAVTAHLHSHTPWVGALGIFSLSRISSLLFPTRFCPLGSKCHSGSVLWSEACPRPASLELSAFFPVCLRRATERGVPNVFFFFFSFYPVFNSSDSASAFTTLTGAYVRRHAPFPDVSRPPAVRVFKPLPRD